MVQDLLFGFIALLVLAIPVLSIGLAITEARKKSKGRAL